MAFPDIKICLNTSKDDLDKELYTPCLQWAKTFDRGVGYFTSGWLSYNARGMAVFAQRGGHARWLTSPILDAQDYKVIKETSSREDIAAYFRDRLLGSIDTLECEIEENTLNALAWMIFDGIIKLRFAVPTKKLTGDFHDKFGIFEDDDGNKLSFSGSINDSTKGFSNYESIKVFRTWDGTAPYVEEDSKRFQHLWDGGDENLCIFPPDEAIRQKIFKLRKHSRPYPVRGVPSEDTRWKHQDEAADKFIQCMHGILEMATGTGKTRTALKIIKKLFNAGSVSRIVITMYGNDLLKQWVKECREYFDVDVHIFEHFETSKELPSFLLCRRKCILIISRDADYLVECINRMEQRFSDSKETTLFVFDEVHGFGSASYRDKLSGRISPYKYRLGLSATPEREYDEDGNNFILNEVGPVIFSFGLEDAIKKGILCEFSYHPIFYKLTDEDRQKKRAIIARYAERKKRNEAVNDEDMYRDLAMVNKLSPSKLPLFRKFITQKPEVLERCLIFVETKEYGRAVQEILIDFCPIYHTYYGEDDADNLARFASGELNCLVTCKKISEGIDIKTVKNIILFSSDRSKLVTTQRIGRSLRIDPNDPSKRANVIDFICRRGADQEDPEELAADEEDAEELAADEARRKWLEQLSQTRRDNA